MRKIFILFFSISIFWSEAQTKIEGRYRVSSGNPDDGGYNWFLLENHNFAMFTFGQMIAGKWSAEGDVITFTPATPQYPFEVFGRNNPKVKGTKVMFNNFDINEDAYIGNSLQGIQPVLSEDANCLPYPLLKEFQDPFKDVVLSTSIRDEEYVGDVQGYNDFIITYYPSQVMISPFTANLKDEKLYFRGDDRPSSSRKDIEPDELEKVKTYIDFWLSSFDKKSIVTNKEYNLVSYTEGFNEEMFLNKEYNYNAATGIYTAKRKNNLPEDAYHDMNVLYKYEKTDLKITHDPHKKSTESVFNITCDK